VIRVRSLARSALAVLQGIWSLAQLDLLRWLRTPSAIASALIPPIGMTVMLIVLSLTVTQEPVALVIQSQGAYAHEMAEMIEADTDSYFISVMSTQEAERALHNQEIAAIITIPPGFDEQVLAHTARLQVTLNNIDIDFADDIRRSVERSAGQFDAAGLNTTASTGQNLAGASPANPYRIVIDEHDLRKTNVDFLRYQVIPVFVLLVLHMGLMGTALFCAQDRERRTARYLVLAPLPDWAFIAGRLLGGFCACGLVVLVAGGICVVTGILAPPVGHWPVLVALFAATALSASGIGAILGTLIRGTRTIALTASLLAIYGFFLGGGFTQIAFLPRWIQVVSAFNPMRYAIDGMRQALFYPELAGVTLDVVVLGGTAVVAVVLAAAVVRRAWSL
jgi:ABC-2 type transport system permease protein